MSGKEKPRIHWVSPLPPAETDIAHYTARILPELAAHTNLVLWTDAPEWDASLEEYCEVRRLDPERVTPRDFASAGAGTGTDTVFIHIGNSWVFHAGLLAMARRIPSVIVLHDLAIQELCRDAMLNNRLSPEHYLEEMARWHGQQGDKMARELIAGTVKPLDLAQQIPGFEICLDCAISVLVHTPAAFEAVTGTGAVPAYLLDLPFRPSSPGVPALRVRQGPLNFVQFGYIGPNRRLEQVLEALAPLKSEVDFRLDVMGNVWDPSYVQSRIDALGLAGRVVIHGFVPEPELDARLAQAHLVFNLRHPTMGEASGSQLRIWNASAASVVTDQGWYSSLADDTVFKIPIENEIEALRSVVRQLHADRESGAKLGEAGRKALEARHTPSRYAEGVAYVARRAAEDARAALLARSARDLLSSAYVQSEIYQDALARRI